MLHPTKEFIRRRVTMPLPLPSNWPCHTYGVCAGSTMQLQTHVLSLPCIQLSPAAAYGRYFGGRGNGASAHSFVGKTRLAKRAAVRAIPLGVTSLAL